MGGKGKVEVNEFVGKRLPRISFDMDGVLCNFAEAFSQLVNHRFGTRITWNDWTTYWVDRGPHPLFSQEQWSYGWETLKTTPDFWASLPGFEDTDYSEISWWMYCGLFTGYLVTRRSDLSLPVPRDCDASVQTRKWLSKIGISNHQGLIVGHYDRVQLLRFLEIDAHLEDWADEFIRLREAGINCYLVDRPHNRHIDVGAYRVQNANEFLRKVIPIG